MIKLFFIKKNKIKNLNFFINYLNIKTKNKNIFSLIL